MIYEICLIDRRLTPVTENMKKAFLPRHTYCVLERITCSLKKCLLTSIDFPFLLPTFKKDSHDLMTLMLYSKSSEAIQWFQLFTGNLLSLSNPIYCQFYSDFPFEWSPDMWEPIVLWLWQWWQPCHCDAWCKDLNNFCFPHKAITETWNTAHETHRLILWDFYSAFCPSSNSII